MELVVSFRLIRAPSAKVCSCCARCSRCASLFRFAICFMWMFWVYFSIDPAILSTQFSTSGTSGSPAGGYALTITGEQFCETATGAPTTCLSAPDVLFDGQLGICVTQASTYTPTKVVCTAGPYKSGGVRVSVRRREGSGPYAYFTSLNRTITISGKHRCLRLLCGEGTEDARAWDVMGEGREKGHALFSRAETCHAVCAS